MRSKKEKPVARFETIYQEHNHDKQKNIGFEFTGTFTIIRDNDTGIHYLRNYDNAATMIPLLGSDGEIVITEPNPEYKANSESE